MDIAQHNTIVLDFVQRAQRSNIVPHQISAETGTLLATLERCLQAKCVLEIGTLWGYSTWWLYQGLAQQAAAQIITIEKELKHSALAQQFLTATGLSDATKPTTVELRSGDATKIIPEFTATTFDFIFLDADRRDYVALLPQLLRVLQPGGLLVVDNVTISTDHANAASLKEFLAQIFQQSNLYSVQLGGSANLMLCLKIGKSGPA
ncbi:MAG: O-methyltransferase [uncultured bacterium]|nr:MAG: O-methyltransferase [uncultured bacterium]